MFDLLLYETGSGGDLMLTGSTIEFIHTNEVLIYLALFSGNEYWANEFFESSEKVNSKTEEAFQNNPLSSIGRLNIENAIIDDLKFIKANVPDAEIEVRTRIVSTDRMKISIRINNLVYVYEYLGDKTIYLGTNELW
ncbi:MAG: hypothetical protein KL787_10055 [Taibaiella sp.]|nr:hypothetical protein [Taibaiella sp.]